jgi:excisionase family DNA binding protein
MTPQIENHPSRLLFDLLLSEFRSVVQSEIAILRDEIKRVGQSGKIVPNTKRFYSLKEAAQELNLSQATVRRLIDRGLLRSSKATCLIRIPGEQIAEFARTTI